jgi:hypothetical protein
MTEKELMQIKKDVETSERLISENTGQLNAYMKQLQTDYDCKTLEELDEKIKEWELEVEKNAKKINKLSDELQTKYNLIP